MTLLELKDFLEAVSMNYSIDAKDCTKWFYSEFFKYHGKLCNEAKFHVIALLSAAIESDQPIFKKNKITTGG